MLIIEVIGGLGNQMFQYAFYIALKKQYSSEETTIYIKRFSETSDNQGYELGSIFNLQTEYCEYDVSELLDDSLKISARIRRKILGAKRSYYSEKIFKFDKKVMELKNISTIYFRGLWQDELYFQKYRRELLEVFEFKNKLNKKNQELLKYIKNTNSVSIHIRRGDYISNKKYRDLLGDVCSYEYYHNAYNHIESRISNLSLFIFSDDINWVKSNFDFLVNKNVFFINHNKGKESYIDMQLMSNCKHNIIANSSFSWWGAWLNVNPSKIVIAPIIWFKENKWLQNNHIVPDSWIKINNKKE